MMHPNMFQMHNPFMFPFNYQDPNLAMMRMQYQMHHSAIAGQNQTKTNTTEDIEDKKSNKSFDKSRDVSLDKSVSTIKSRKSKIQN